MAGPTPNQRRIIKALLDSLEPKIRDAFLLAIQTAVDSIDARALIEALQARDIEGAVALLRIPDGVLFPLDDAIRGGYVEAGSSVALSLPNAMRGGFGFNGRHPRAETWISRIGGELIAGIQADTITMARETILQGMVDNVTPSEVARSLVGTVNRVTGKREGGFIGLDGPRAHRLAQVTAGMKTPEGVQDLVTLRNGVPTVRYKVNAATERRILAAYRRGEAVAPADRAISERQLSNKLLKERGETIARNEAFTAQAEGRDEAYRQIMERGDVESISVRWQHNLSQVPRPDHVAMDGKTIKLGETFDFGDAKMRFPHDPAGGPKHSIGCRCVAVYRVNVARA